jgi:uncharacterized delta-60 repeat protein
MIGGDAGRRRRQRIAGLSALAAVLATAWAAQAAAAAPADLDRSFGGDGIVQVEGAAGASFSSEASARMAIGPHDETYVLYSIPRPCGGSPGSCQIALSVARYEPNGMQNPIFGTRPGSELVVQQNPLAHEFELAVGPDGKPVVAAMDAGTMRIARFDLAGLLDGTFGGGSGSVQGGFPGGIFSDPAVAVQEDGKVVVGAEGAHSGGLSELLLARFLPGGERDPSFGKGGEVVVSEPTRTWPASILLGPGGTISVASPRCCGGSPLFASGVSVARFLTDGQPDPGFATSGHAFLPTPGAEGTVRGVALRPDGGLAIAIEESNERVSIPDLMTELTPSGSVDTAFGAGGRLRLFYRVGAISPSAIAVDSKGRIVGVGWNGRMVAFRLRPDGSADRTFNAGQRLVTEFGGNQEAALGVGLQSNGRIVALGETSCCGPRQFALIALRGGTARSRCLGHRATIVGTQGKDEIVGTLGRDVIAALGGNDKVRGRSGADLICGGKGHDKLLGGPGRDQIRP